MSGDELTDQAWARISAHLQKRGFILHVPLEGKPWLEQKRRQIWKTHSTEGARSHE